MCGITGFVDFQNKSTRSVLQQMNDTLHHRGPDGEGLEFVQQPLAVVGMAHRRLSIIDLSEGGKQPKQYKHFTITFNGEIYNYNEIKKELTVLGHQFNSHSDTEVLLHSYEEWGTKAVDKLIGMFAFVIFDAARNELFCCRDRAGVKPFFYSFQNDVFLFASELKALLQHPAFDKKINMDAVASFLQFGYVPHPHCIYQQTSKLSPGHHLTLNLASKEMVINQYWNVYDYYNKPKLTIDLNEAITQTEALLISACQYRMVSDVPVGIFLSGGYDSSVVTALLQHQSSTKLKTFTIGFKDDGINEAHHAKAVAQHLGTDHYDYICTEKEALDIVPTLPYYYDEPFADSSAIPTTLVSKMAKQQVTVAISADAGDEVFAGYNRYEYLQKFGGKIQSMPWFARNALSGLMSKVDADAIPILRTKYLFHSRYEKVKQLLLEPDDRKMNLALSKQFTEQDVTKLLKQSWTSVSSAFDSNELSAETYDVISSIMAIDYQTYLVDDIMQKVDRATMTHSLEGREPFLDHRVIEWAAQLPTSYKYHKGITKYILKEIAHRYIPKDIMERPKMGFGVPVNNWLVNELRPLVDHYLSVEYLAKQGIFNTQYVVDLKAAFYKGKKEKAEKIWYLLMFQLWFEQWMT